MLKRFISILIFLFPAVLTAQDIHFSQYWENPLLLNPGFTGTDKALVRANTTYRNQWASIGNIYTTSALSGDMKLKPDGKSSFFGTGIFVIYDNAASGSLSKFSAGITLSSSVHFGKGKYLSLGIQGAWNQNSIRFDNSTWDKQYEHEFNSALSSGENLSVSGKNYIDAGAGIVFYKNGNGRDFNSKNDNSFQFGISAFHVNRPDIGIYGVDKLNIRYNAFAKMDIVLASKFSLQPVAYFAMQGPLKEINTGSLLRYSLSEQNKMGTGITQSIAFGLFYRYGDALYPAFQFEWKNWLAGLSYDMNLSNLSSWTKGKGGIELTLRYRFMPVESSSSKRSF
ncbi:MAG: PorP/SprF family type IX secretion system membrane protein [Bacteroidota bacterium]